MSASCVKFLFKKILPDLSGKTLIDVGSRLGPVLYGVSRFRFSEPLCKLLSFGIGDEQNPVLVRLHISCQH